MGKKNNLLQNPRAKDGLDGWEVVESGGDGFCCEETPASCKQLCECSNVQDEMGCWCASHELCMKTQTVDLLAAGISDDRLDNKKPPIRVRDWYCARSDCGCHYKIKVRLLGEDKDELDSWEFEDDREEGTDWIRARKVFKGYPSGVRFVEYTHGGKDNKCWAGHYGVKMTNSAVVVGKKRSNKKKRAVREVTGKNLLKNPCGGSGTDDWEVTQNGGDGIKVEEEPAGCCPVKEANPDADEDCCWATSFGECELKQTIDLGFNGFDGTFMDEKQPDIVVSEWFGGRNDAGYNFWLRVRLLNADLEEIDKFDVNETNDASDQWTKVEHTFSNYGEGVRFVDYVHGGKDTCFWQGHFGAKMTCASVVINAEKESSSSSSSSCSSSSSSDEN